MFFREWKMSTLLSNFQKRKNETICRKYATKWMDLISMKHLAHSIVSYIHKFVGHFSLKIFEITREITQISLRKSLPKMMKQFAIL